MSPEFEEKGKKRHRRTAQEIERKHPCEFASCGKSYGSEGALKMHIRLKHSGVISDATSSPEPVSVSVSSPSTVASSPSSPPSSAPSSPASSSISYDEPEEVVVTPVTPVEEDEFKSLRDRFCHMFLLRLNIGLWQAESQCCGDLVAKFSYKERTILWEIFDVGSLLRTVISFDDLNGVGLELHPDDTATMVIELRCAPKFYKGVLQPHEATIWTQIGDFTEGMASTFRRHILHFSRRALNEPIEDIFRRDPRLQGLLLQGLPALKSPYFVPETVVSVRSPGLELPDVQQYQHHPPAPSPQPQQQKQHSNCAQQNGPNYPCFLDTSSERVLLPCNHSIVATRDLLRECPCTICGTSYFFSFCAQRVVSTDEMWHCSACNGCKTKKEWHCSRCNKCTRVPPAPGINNHRGAQICQACAKQVQIPMMASQSPSVQSPISGRGRKRKATPITPPPSVPVPPTLYLY